MKTVSAMLGVARSNVVRVIASGWTTWEAMFTWGGGLLLIIIIVLRSAKMATKSSVPLEIFRIPQSGMDSCRP